MNHSKPKEQKLSSSSSTQSFGRLGRAARGQLEDEIYRREHEVLALKVTLNELKREVAGAALSLLELSGALEEALRADRPQAVLELRRLVSRIKGMV